VIRFSTTRSARTEGLWPVLTLLFVVVLVPTISVLWFMTKAVENERLAVRQTLSEVLRLRLADTRKSVDDHWDETLAAISAFAEEADSPIAFESVVSAGLADSVILYDADGQITYPNTPEFQATALEESTESWLAAERAEYANRDPATAAELYSFIAQDSTDVNFAARALVAETRCRGRAGQNDSAIALATETLQAARFDSTTATNGRLIVPNAQMLALKLMGDPLHPSFDSTVESLRERLLNYEDAAMTSAQRRFLMRELQELVPSIEPFPTLRAEQLAALYVDAGVAPARGSLLRPSGASGLLHVTSPDGRAVALYHEDTVTGEIREIVGNQSIPRGAVIEVLTPGKTPSASSPVVEISASQYLQDWRLSFRFDDSSVFDSAANGRIASHIWTGALVIAAALTLAAILARYMTRQLRLARLKNDLAATVSHELKTPLTSMRVFVDTLLNGETTDAETTREYLQLIAKENTRLSHLIDNFLNYSRMSRNRQTFKFTEVSPSDLVDSAIEAVVEKLDSAGFQLEKDIQIDLPTIEADADALVTALINLLDNAYKYSGDNKHVRLLAYRQDNWVCFEVIDRGIGLTKRERASVFEKYYRVDQRLSSGTSGVGLGLSIVRFIVRAHGGLISVDSQIGLGSTFTVKIPTAETKNAPGPPRTDR
jgi:two-component system, OmpR family, phosphate regulon sensor histidine kinase PhoR